MKGKRILIALLLLISCIFAFSACSKCANFNFDEDSTVNLTYTCNDEEKNFDAELNPEQSRKFILSLNKLSYSYVSDKDMDFEPSYDLLNIKINNETLRLYDVSYIINYGGYFYLNGMLCQSEEKFSFLETYLDEYGPNTIAFGVQYVKQTVGKEENCQIIKNVSQLNDYIAAETQNIDLPDIVLFKDEVVNKYNDEYFENSFIVVFMKAASSGSFGFRVNDVSTSGGRLIINYEIIVPSDKNVGVTCDMAYWYSFVEISNGYSAVKNVNLISLK